MEQEGLLVTAKSSDAKVNILWGGNSDTLQDSEKEGLV